MIVSLVSGAGLVGEGRRVIDPSITHTRTHARRRFAETLNRTVFDCSGCTRLFCFLACLKWITNGIFPVSVKEPPCPPCQHFASQRTTLGIESTFKRTAFVQFTTHLEAIIFHHLRDHPCDETCLSKTVPVGCDSDISSPKAFIPRDRSNPRHTPPNFVSPVFAEKLCNLCNSSRFPSPKKSQSAKASLESSHLARERPEPHE